MDAISRYLDEVDEVMRLHPDQREGQAHLNAFCALFPRLPHGLIGTDFDPFHDDRRLPRFLDWVSKTLTYGPLVCGVCGQEATPYPRDDGNRLLCTWCLAWTWAPYDEPATTPEYRVVDERWAADTFTPTRNVEHADIGNGSSLCGIPHGLEVYRHLWRPEKSCADCATKAHEIDARWPHGR